MRKLPDFLSEIAGIDPGAIAYSVQQIRSRSFEKSNFDISIGHAKLTLAFPDWHHSELDRVEQYTAHVTMILAHEAIHMGWDLGLIQHARPDIEDEEEIASLIQQVFFISANMGSAQVQYNSEPGMSELDISKYRAAIRQSFPDAPPGVVAPMVVDKFLLDWLGTEVVNRDDLETLKFVSKCAIQNSALDPCQRSRHPSVPFY